MSGCFALMATILASLILFSCPLSPKGAVAAEGGVKAAQRPQSPAGLRGHFA